MNTPVYITIVLKFESLEATSQATFAPGMKLLGGMVDAVQFDDALNVIEGLENQIEELETRIAILNCA